MVPNTGRPAMHGAVPVKSSREMSHAWCGAKRSREAGCVPLYFTADGLDGGQAGEAVCRMLSFVMRR